MQVHVWSLRSLISINSFCQPAITPGMGLVTHPSVDEDDTRSHTGARIYRAEESLFNKTQVLSERVALNEAEGGHEHGVG